MPPKGKKTEIWLPDLDFLKNGTRSALVSVSAVLGNEYPVLVFEYRKTPGISRVNPPSVRCPGAAGGPPGVVFSS